VRDVWGRPESRAVLGRGAGGDGTVVIDNLAEQVVLQELELEHRRGRNFYVISEEAGERAYGDGGDVIVIDPIDGSHNAKMGIPYFSLTLAVARDRTFGSVYEAAVRNLVTGDHYQAMTGGGAELNGERLQPAAPGDGDAQLNILQIEPVHLLDRVALYAPLIDAAEKVRMLGSAALNICLCATGAVSVSLAPTLRSVDCVAPLLILAEAGGGACDFEGGSVAGRDMALDQRTSLVAAHSPALLERAMTLLGGKVRA
jgi:myo-inositol-1(or 4)-monophosphatase